jgi:creatinine amidohydrolase
MNKVARIALAIGFALTVLIALGLGQAGNQPQHRDTLNMERPIEMHDTVWIGELTSLEVRDLIKAGKTTALILGGGMEENGPYLTLDKHNDASRAMGESIARKLGNALCAPILTMEPGDPDHPKAPGMVVFAADTYKAALSDMASSLRAMGFQKIVFLGDHGGDMQPMEEVSKDLNVKWKGEGATNYFVEKYGNGSAARPGDSGCCGWGSLVQFEQNTLGIHEKDEDLHDDYLFDSIIMTVNVNSIRMPERIKAKKTTINGVDLAPMAKTIENGRKLIAYRTEVTVKEIQRLMAGDRRDQ